MKEKINIDFRRNILNEMFKSGRFGTIRFYKKDGSERTMNCRIKRVSKELRKSNNKTNKEVMTFWDMTKKGYRSVKLENLISISANNDFIKFTN